MNSLCDALKEEMHSAQSQKVVHFSIINGNERLVGNHDIVVGKFPKQQDGIKVTAATMSSN
jgi:hypothetical protein